MANYDLIIKNGKIIDGTGSPWFKSDIGIKNQKIKKIGKINSNHFTNIINAKGLLITPGFIDPHSHSDLTFLLDRFAKNRVYDGVTTEINGNCGFSFAPLNERSISLLNENIPYFGPFIKNIKAHGISFDWYSLDDYFNKLIKNGIAINTMMLVGHNTLRLGTIGENYEEPTQEQLTEMKNLLDKSMNEGAAGISTGLTYRPGCLTKTEEIIELSKVVAHYNGIYATHIREWGSIILKWSAKEGTVLEGVAEGITIAKKSGVNRVQISHLGTKFPMWGKEKEIFTMIEEARKNGIDVTADIQPSYTYVTSLSSAVPPWIHRGGKETMFRRLRDPKCRKKIINDMKNPDEWVKGCKRPPHHVIQEKWSAITILPPYKSHLKNKEIEGKTIKEISDIRKSEPAETILDIIIEEDNKARMTFESMKDYLRKQQISHPLMMIGSDGMIIPDKKPFTDQYIDPQIYGTYSQIIGKWIREENVLPLEETIRKMTSLPARAFKIFDRGIIRPGFFADINVIDYETINNFANFYEPHRKSEGIIHVIVNGELILEDKKITYALPGKIIKHQV